MVVNTCTVTAATDAQSRNLVRRARRLNAVLPGGGHRLLRPGRSAGAARHPRGLPGPRQRGETGPSGPARADADRGEPAVRVSDIRETCRSEAVPPLSSLPSAAAPSCRSRTAAMLSAAYCIIPYARGSSRSVPPDEVVAQVEAPLRRRLSGDRADGHPYRWVRRRYRQGRPTC